MRSIRAILAVASLTVTLFLGASLGTASAAPTETQASMNPGYFATT